MSGAEQADGLVVGLDIGADSSMIVVETGEIVRNELGGHSSASLLGFNGAERFVGEAGTAQLVTNAANTVRVGEWLSLNRALGTHRPKLEGSVEVEYCGKKLSLERAAAIGTLARKLGTLATKAVGRANFVVGVPPCWSPEQLAAISVGLDVARLPPPLGRRRLVRSDACFCEVYALKHAQSIPAGELRTVAIVDVGRCTATATIAKFYGGESPRYEILSTTSTQSDVGTAALDAALYELSVRKHCIVGVEKGSKRGARLLSTIEKARKLLSTMHEASVTCENLVDDRDMLITLTRDEFQAAAASSLDALNRLFAEAKGDCIVDSVELVGGGCRVALVRELVREVFALKELGGKLDDASLAHGAALAAKRNESEQSSIFAAEPDGCSDTCAVDALAAAEDDMCARDEAVAANAEKRNALETHILELRAAMNSGRHNAAFPADFGAVLDDYENLLWEENVDYAARLESLDSQARELAPEYFRALEEERAAREKALEDEAKQPQDDDDDDERREDRLNADTRKLRFNDRFRLVQKNKDEGSELFKDGNFHHAAKRYKDALAHASKLTYDLTPDQHLLATRTKIDLHLNMSLCWNKLENLEQSVRCCGEALKLDDTNPKALYRRAYAYEHMKRYDDAKQDIKKAIAASPEDKAILQLQKRIDAQLLRQKKKEKAMWGKAFS